VNRREIIAGLGSAAAWPVVAQAQQAAIPVAAFVSSGVADGSAGYVAAFRRGLGETGYVEGQNVAVEYHWLEGQYDRLPTLMADLVRRRVAVIGTPGSVPGSTAAKAATATIPIVFGVGQDPVNLGLVASLASPPTCRSCSRPSSSLSSTSRPPRRSASPSRRRCWRPRTR
jgi:putative ABC transport system substrate-binding protein